MAFEIDFIPALPELSAIISHDIAFIAFNYMLVGNNSLNHEEQTLTQKDDGTWEIDAISSNVMNPVPSDQIKSRYVLALPYFFPSMQTTMSVYRDAVLNLRIFGKFYKKVKSKIDSYQPSNKQYFFTDLIEDGIRAEIKFISENILGASDDDIDKIDDFSTDKLLKNTANEIEKYLDEGNFSQKKASDVLVIIAGDQRHRNGVIQVVRNLVDEAMLNAGGSGLPTAANCLDQSVKIKLKKKSYSPTVKWTAFSDSLGADLVNNMRQQIEEAQGTHRFGIDDFKRLPGYVEWERKEMIKVDREADDYRSELLLMMMITDTFGSLGIGFHKMSATYKRPESLATVKVFKEHDRQMIEMILNTQDQLLRSNDCTARNLDKIAAYLKPFEEQPGEREPSQEKLEKRRVSLSSRTEARPYNEANPEYSDSDSEPGLNQRPTTRREAASKSKGWVDHEGKQLPDDPPDKTDTGMFFPIIIGVAAVGIIYFMSK